MKRLIAHSIMLMAILLPAYTQEIEVTTGSGRIAGRSENGLEVYQGIPYAEPPVGNLRFTAPIPVRAWEGILDAKNHSFKSAQTISGMVYPDIVSEDSLTLSITRPESDAVRSSNGDAARPVFVWIHGGANTSGSASDDVYNGNALALNGDLIVVHVQYRLGIFGWLDLSQFGGETGSGNNGLRDIILALRWIRENIEHFGGDPDNITIAGESAGAANIGALLKLNEAQGLFHRVIMQSGHPNVFRPAEDAAKLTAQYMDIAGAESLNDLRALSMTELLEAQRELMSEIRFGLIAFGPTIDGSVLTEKEHDAVVDGDTPVPVMLGSTRDEVRYWISRSDFLDRLPLNYWRHWLNHLTAGGAEEMLNTYRSFYEGYTNSQIGIALDSDTSFLMPAIRFAESASEKKNDIWLYLLRTESNIENGRFGSPHTMDLPFMFGNFDTRLSRLLLDMGKDSEGYVDFSADMQSAWIHFARQGDPSSPRLGEWPVYDTDRRSTMVFNFDSRVEDDPVTPIREAWAALPFDGASPSYGDWSPIWFEGTKIGLLIILTIIGPARIIAAFAVLLLIVAALVLLIRRMRGRAGTHRRAEAR